MSFADELAKESDNVIAAAREVVKVTAITMFTDVIFSTPVGNPDLWQGKAPAGYTGGQARSNWFLTFTTPSNKVTDNTERGDYDEGKISSEISKQVAQNRGSVNADRYYLTNNLPYIQELESGLQSTQAPNGMVAPAKLRTESLVPRITQAAEKKYGVS